MSINKEKLYRLVWDNCDQNNELKLSQEEIGAIAGVNNRTISEYLGQFIQLGIMRKAGQKFVPMYHPDKIPWDKFNENLYLMLKHFRDNNLTKTGQPKQSKVE